mgnify:CR=1 FL=1
MATFCKGCNNILDITRTVKKGKLDGNPDTVSSSEEEHNYAEIIEKILKNKSVEKYNLTEKDIKAMQKDSSYRKKSSKDKKLVKIAIDKMLDVLTTKDENNSDAFYICTNCSYSEPIKSGDLIISRSNESSTGHDPLYKIKLRNNFFSNILPHTREYNCKNSKCPTHKGVPRSAKFFREPKTTHTWYLCEVCVELWRIS